MPPTAKFTKEEIIAAALDLVKAGGKSALTARALGQKLGSSARPIFTVFQSMEEVQELVLCAAKELYTSYVNHGLNQTKVPAFKGVGLQYIKFALAEPKLFQILFMSRRSQTPTVMDVLPVIDDNYPKILSSVQSCYGLSCTHAQWLYRHLWIYTHGIAALCATDMCTFTEAQLGQMMTEVCTALLKEIKGIQND